MFIIYTYVSFVSRNYAEEQYESSEEEDFDNEENLSDRLKFTLQ